MERRKEKFFYERAENCRTRNIENGKENSKEQDMSAEREAKMQRRDKCGRFSEK